MFILQKSSIQYDTIWLVITAKPKHQASQCFTKLVRVFWRANNYSGLMACSYLCMYKLAWFYRDVERNIIIRFWTALVGDCCRLSCNYSIAVNHINLLQ